MPQFEVKDTGSSTSTLIRARSVEDAVRIHFSLEPKAKVAIDQRSDIEALSGWRKVEVDGRRVGDIRPFQRMKFRRA